MRCIGVATTTLAALTLIVAGCQRQPQTVRQRPLPPYDGGVSPAPDTFFMTSSAFKDGGKLPVRYTDDGEDISPPLAWQGTPRGTASFVLVMDDPDAPSGTFTHWVLYNLPGEGKDLPAAVPKTETLPKLGGAEQGLNSAGKIGYMGPAPPPGRTHHYRFTIYALNVKLDLAPGVQRAQLDKALRAQAVILGQSMIIGTYRR